MLNLQIDVSKAKKQNKKSSQQIQYPGTEEGSSNIENDGKNETKVSMLSCTGRF